MHSYQEEGLQWEKELSECSDEELISRHNGSVGLRCFGLARQMYLGCLEREILARDFDSSLLFERDRNGKVTAYRLSEKVKISEIDCRRILVATQTLITTMRKYHKTFHCIGSVNSDPCPGMSDSWDVFIARTRDGRFFACQSEGETDFEIGDAREAAEWILTESGVDDLGGIIDAIGEIRGFKKLIGHLGFDGDE